MNFKQKLRLRIVLFLFFLISILIGITLYDLQVIRGRVMLEKAENQYSRPKSSVFKRGTIFLTKKYDIKIVGASNANGYNVFFNPSLIENPNNIYESLSIHLDLDREDFMRRAKKIRSKYEELGRRIDEKRATEIRNLGINGVYVSKESWRVYPADNLFANTLGIIGENDSGVLVGKYGLERYYEDILSRPNDNSFGLFSLFSNNVDDRSSHTDIVGNNKKGDIITSLDANVGIHVSRVLKKTKENWQADTIGAIVMDPNTGSIISANILPDFDPNNLGKVKDIKVLSNPLVEHAYEMGSIMKPLTMAIGMDTNVVNIDSTYNDTGSMTLNEKTISNYDGKARGVTDMQTLLSKSLNVGAATIALKVGHQKINEYFRSLGFGAKTGVDLPTEATGIIGNLSSGKDIDIATASYGQGVAVSPIQMITALSSLANGGYIVTPHFVEKIEYTDGTLRELDYKKNKVFEKKTVDTVTRMLVKVVDDSLQNGAIKKEHYTIAAKTGTAQIPDPINGGYYKDRYLHSFFGYFPAYKPKYIVFLYHIYPKGAKYASETLTKPFDEIVTFLIDYYNIEPDR